MASATGRPQAQKNPVRAELSPQEGDLSPQWLLPLALSQDHMLGLGESKLPFQNSINKGSCEELENSWATMESGKLRKAVP